MATKKPTRKPRKRKTAQDAIANFELQSKYALTLQDKFDMIRMSLQAVIQGYSNARFITGQPGAGKSKTVTEELDAGDVDYILISGGVKNAPALYKMLYYHNDPNRIIVFDDCNDIFRDKQAVEILRVAVDTNPVRRITYAGQLTTRTDKRSYPDTFEFKSRIIIISNVPISRIDKAIVSRTSPIEVWVTKEEMLQYIGMHLHAAPPTGIPIEWKHHIYDFLTKELPLSEINRIDFRVFKDACLWYAANKGTPSVSANSEQWKKMVYTLVH